MKRARLDSAFFVLTLLAAAACSSSTPAEGPSGSGGSLATSGGTPSMTGGQTAAGGATSPLAGASGVTGGMPAASGGGSNSGGGGAPGAAGGSVARGGSSGTGGSGGSVSSGGTSGTREVKPSAGCALASMQVTIPNSLVGVPTGYTGKDPVPVVIAFHAAGNDNTSIQSAFKNSDLAKKYLMVYPNSTSATTSNKTGWSMQADKSRVLEVQAAILTQACVDENRIYATGHSSGAQMVAQLLCSGDGNFDAVAPVASSVYCSKWKNGAVPSLTIHGVQDSERAAYGLNDGNGAKDIQTYLTSNMCTMTSTPFDPVLTGCTNVKTGIDGKPFDAGCVEFSGCAVPTRWCNHNDPQYGTSNHGIPCFGVRAIYDFFESLH